MMRTAQSGFARRWAHWAAGVVMILGRSHAVGRSPVPNLVSDHLSAKASVAAAGAFTISEPSNHFEIRNYFMNFDGDHSLDAATVIEQSSAGDTRYTVRLHLASGAEQSIVVAAPPGGLQIEMHDMTGDNIPNDVVLRPALVRWLPTILVNDGHEHFDVAMSGTDPSSFSSNEDLGSRRHDSQSFAFLMSSGFKTAHLPNSRWPFDPQLRECLFSSFVQTVSNRLGYASSPGRAPPLAKAI